MTEARGQEGKAARVADALIVSAVRTPVGRHGGALADVRPDDLAAVALKAVVERAKFDPSIEGKSIAEINKLKGKP